VHKFLAQSGKKYEIAPKISLILLIINLLHYFAFLSNLLTAKKESKMPQKRENKVCK
jgi:hypothetical protein